MASACAHGRAAEPTSSVDVIPAFLAAIDSLRLCERTQGCEQITVDTVVYEMTSVIGQVKWTSVVRTLRTRDLPRLRSGLRLSTRVDRRSEVGSDEMRVTFMLRREPPRTPGAAFVSAQIEHRAHPLGAIIVGYGTRERTGWVLSSVRIHEH